MNSLARLLKNLENISSTTEKMIHIREHADDASIELMRLTLSPQVTFGVKDFDMPTRFASTDPSPKIFTDLVNKLQARELTGGDARTTITRVLAAHTEATASALYRVLKRDLKVSVGISLINKALGYDAIDEFTAMKGDKMSPKFNWNSGPWFTEYKYDGMRVISFVADGGVRYFSYDGNEQFNVPKFITDAILKMVPDGDMVLDGEIFGESYKYTMKAMKAAHNPNAKLRYIMFDAMALNQWNVKDCRIKFKERRADVEALAANGSNVIVPSIGKLCTTRQAVEDFYRELVAEGAEGVMIKQIDHLYQWKRTKTWTKYKPIWTADLECYAVYEGDKDKGLAGNLGGVKLRGTLEDGTYVETDCGSGFVLKREKGSDTPTRSEIWKNPKLVIGKVLEVEYQEVSQASGDKHKSLRFVVFKHIRTDKTVK